MKLCECGCGGVAPLAKQTRRALGHVKGEPVRFICGHHRRKHDPNGSWEVRDCGYTTPCWIWQGTLDSRGYALLTRDGKDLKGYRVIYERFKGPIPPGLVPDHLCRVRACVCPDHLEPVTNAENIRRGSRAKLTHEIAAKVRAASGTQREIAARFGISQSVVKEVKAGRAWA